MTTPPDTVIARLPPNDGRDWDVQCARCGSSLAFDDCKACGGDCFVDHDCGEDTCMCLHPEDNVACGVCGGAGGFPECMSTEDWCNTHPMPGREQQPRSSTEWFTLDKPRSKR